MIKNVRTKLAASIGLTLIAGTAQAVVTELAVNGGFETGQFCSGGPCDPDNYGTGWQTFPQSGANLIAAGNASTYSGNSTLPGGPADNLIKQANLAAGVITTADELTIKFDVRGSLGVSAVAQAILFSEFTGGGAIPQFFDFALNPNPDIWTSYTWMVNPTGADVGGGVSLALKIGCGAVDGCVADVFWDNVSITADLPVSAVPVPAAVWLFGSGLLGLVGVARRKKLV